MLINSRDHDQQENLKTRVLRCAKSLLGAVLMILVATMTILAVTNAGMTPQDQDFRINL